MWSSTCCWKKFPSYSDIFWQTSDHLLPCCCFCVLPCMDWLSCASRARLVCDWYKGFVGRDDLPTFSRSHCCSCCFCHCYYEKNSPNHQRHTHDTPFYFTNTISPVSADIQLTVGYPSPTGLCGIFCLTEPERARWHYSQDNYCFSKTALKRTCISHS